MATVDVFLLDAKAAHAARRQYAKASEYWSEYAVRLLQAGDPLSKAAATLANRVRRRGNEEAG